MSIYTFLQSQTLSTVSLGGMTNISLLISSLCREIVLMTMEFNLYFICVVNTITNVSASFEHLVDVLVFVSLYFS